MANDVIEVMYSTWPDVYMCARTLQADTCRREDVNLGRRYEDLN